MKIVFFSDTHLGFTQEKRTTEAFDQCKTAFELAIAQQPDLIVLAGDLVHHSVPSQETWLEVAQLFSLPQKQKQSEIKLFKEKNGAKHEVHFQGIPVVSIHGTHEHRAKDYANVLDIMEYSGFLTYLHGCHVIAEKGNTAVVVHGMSGVPEKKALDVLKYWNPKPVENVKNILVLHQSIKEFLPFDDEMVASISVADLPGGFDLIVNGHLHWTNEFSEHGKHLLLTGSTVITQMKNLESKKPKCIHVLDTQTNQLTKLEIPNQRRLYYEKIEFTGESLQEVFDKVYKTVSDVLEKHKESSLPLIKVKLLGKLAVGLKPGDLSVDDLLNPWDGKAIVAIDKSFAGSDLRSRIKHLAELQQSKQSILSLGLDLLEKNLDKTSFDKSIDSKHLFELLEQGEEEKVIELLSKKKN
ncbi:MAG: DNA repair exonuclease [Candidatus Diapherotrites archaeon]|nr:DNA repair exonuclease [Candidatus Diapherotrites archaeon]